MNNRTLFIEALGYKRNKAWGYQEFLFNLLNYFYKNRILLTFDKVIIICCKSQKDDFSYLSPQISTREYAINSLFTRIPVQIALPFSLGLKQSDVILYTANYSSSFKKCRQVLVIHDLLYLRKNLLPDFKVRLQRKLSVKRSLKISDAVIAISDYTRSDILDKFPFIPDNKVVKIYNYFNFLKFDGFRGTNTSGKEFFLSVSTTAVHKNVITVLKAFAMYCKSNSDTDLYFVGSIDSPNELAFLSSLSEKIRMRIHTLSNISSSQLACLYSSCKAFISASMFEGLGMPVIEAMFFNAQLILSDIEVFHEITDSRAIFFNPFSWEELSEILINLRPCEIETRSFVLEKYSELNTSKKFIQVLNSI